VFLGRNILNVLAHSVVRPVGPSGQIVKSVMRDPDSRFLRRIQTQALPWLPESDVYRIDLSMLVCEYIGETEMNLAKVINLAEHRNEFSSSTKPTPSSANRRASKMRTSATRTRKSAICCNGSKTSAVSQFLRLTSKPISMTLPPQVLVGCLFPDPKAEERLRIWQNAFSPKAALEAARL
jgi:hypothetical protein